MPRISEARKPAEPSSADQKDRYRRILRAASRLGTEHGFDRVQMVDVAKEAGVAIATLYRYFPSKTDLFAGVLHSQVERLHDATTPLSEPGHRAEAVGAVLVQVGREYTPANEAFHQVLLAALGVEEGDDEDLRMIRIVEQAWYGILVSTLNGVITQAQCEADILLACGLLLESRYDGGPDA